jgi:Transposase zinc-binding domain
MSRPLLELADIVRAAGQHFIDNSRHWIQWQHVKVLFAIQNCRTAAMGGHVDRCSQCGRDVISFNSCLMGSVLFWGVAVATGL